MNWDNITIDIKHDPLSEEDLARLHQGWQQRRNGWHCSVIFDPTATSATSSNEPMTTIVESTARVVPLPGEETPA
jgi:hypothetical protein